ncbi:MAG: cytochrome c [Rhodocyclales bacterium]|nr:cytochrome c [Rhodocyclales bacterium]
MNAHMLGMAACMLMTAGSAVAQQGDPSAALDKRSICIGCHGIPGYRTAYPAVYPVPKLGGQHAAYIVRALQAYRGGERNHPSMRAIAQSLTDQDMADLAAYYAMPREGAK